MTVFVLLLPYILGVVVVAFAIYGIVRLAMKHALEKHARQNGGKPERH